MTTEFDDRVTAIIYSLQQTFDLPEQVAQAAAQLYDQYRTEQENLYGKRLETTAAACLFLAARIHDQAPIPEEVAVQVGEDEKFLLRRTKAIAAKVGLDVSALIDPVQYAEMICEDLDLGHRVINQAKLLIEHAREEGIASGKSPRGQAAAAVYAAGRLQGRKVTQSQVSGVIDVSEVTIRNRYQEMVESNPPVYGRDTGQDEFLKNEEEETGESADSDEPTERADGYIPVSDDTLDAAREVIDDLDREVERRTQSLFELAQDSPDCEVIASAQVEEWVMAAVCVALEEVGDDPTIEQKTEFAELVDITSQQLEGRCYKLRRAVEQQA